MHSLNAEAAYPDVYREDFETGRWYHGSDCPSFRQIDGKYPIQLRERWHRCLLSLDGLWWLTACFWYPILAKS